MEILWHWWISIDVRAALFFQYVTGNRFLLMDILFMDIHVDGQHLIQIFRYRSISTLICNFIGHHFETDGKHMNLHWKNEGRHSTPLSIHIYNIIYIGGLGEIERLVRPPWPGDRLRLVSCVPCVRARRSLQTVVLIAGPPGCEYPGVLCCSGRLFA